MEILGTYKYENIIERIIGLIILSKEKELLKELLIDSMYIGGKNELLINEVLDNIFIEGYEINELNRNLILIIMN